jgi:hypothetical protein
MRYTVILLLLLSGMTASNAGTLMDRLRLAQNKRLRNASQIAIRTTFPVLRIVGYQERALRNVQPRRRRAKPNAADSSSSSISWIVRAAQTDLALLILAKPDYRKRRANPTR